LLLFVEIMSANSDYPTTKRLLQLSNEVGRIASSLARLSMGEGQPPNVHFDAGSPEVSPDSVAAVIRRRNARARYLPKVLFAEPAWDMMLDLLQAEMMDRRVSVSSVCMAAGVPPTTALRHLKRLEDEGLILRQPDPFDGRRFWLQLAPDVSTSIRRWFADNPR
jgi:DNA-binding transcriptional ArsR family regulator